MKELIGFVYIWINKINGRMYIGKHKGKLTDNYMGSGTIFVKAIKKYGKENFERKILYLEYESERRLYEKEFEYINLYNAVFDRKFYNQTNYDPNSINYIENDGKFTRIVSEETKQKMSKIAKERIVSEETKQKMSKTRKGRVSHTKGKFGLTSGAKNGQFGKHWYNNGIQSFTYKPGEEPLGWIKGRLLDNKADKNPFFGKTHTEETKQKIRIKQRERYENSKKDNNN